MSTKIKNYIGFLSDSDIVEIMSAKKVSCFGDVENMGIRPENVVFDNIGRPCQQRVSQKPSSTEMFLDPIKTALFIE